MLDAGWITDLEVHRRSGASVEDRGDHLIVRTPANPTYHWGNCLLVADPDAADDADRWLAVFREAFPDAGWTAVGLPRMPGDVAAWSAHGLGFEVLEVMETGTLPEQAPLVGSYTVRPLAGEDWEQAVDLAADEDATSAEPSTYERFARRRMEAQRALCADGVAAFFGAFAGGELIAQAGVVGCGSTARYQHVVTAAPHRRQGLASHLVGVAGRWAEERGCIRWVIVTDVDNPAARVYRRAGFERAATNVQVYRPR